MNGSIITPPLAIVAATSAIWVGVTVTRAWPNDAVASSASSTKSSHPASVSGVTEEADDRQGMSCSDRCASASQNPKSSAPAMKPRWPKLEADVGEVDVARHLHGLRTGPTGPASGRPRSCSLITKPSTTMPLTSSSGWVGKVVSDVMAPASSAAAAVSTFMIEPGT